MKTHIEDDEKMNHTVLRLFVENSELFRKDFTAMLGNNSYTTIRRTKKHMKTMRKIFKELTVLIKYREKQLIEARWGGTVPRDVKMVKRKSDSEPLLF